MELKQLISENTIQRRVKELAKELNLYYAGKNWIIVGVLRGAFIFVADLVRNFCLSPEIDFVLPTSYRGNQSVGEVKLLLQISRPIKGKHVLLVEDIVDSGKTIRFLLKNLTAFEPADVRVCSLLSKSGSHDLEKDLLRFVGFEIGKDFVVGYGLDYQHQYRFLPYLAKL